MNKQTPEVLTVIPSTYDPAIVGIIQKMPYVLLIIVALFVGVAAIGASKKPK